MGSPAEKVTAGLSVKPEAPPAESKPGGNTVTVSVPPASAVALSMTHILAATNVGKLAMVNILAVMATHVLLTPKPG